MAKYGNDKPDIRFGMEFGELNAIAQHKDFTCFNYGGIGSWDCSARRCLIYQKGNRCLGRLGTKASSWGKRHGLCEI